jgi:hypothetical protein
MLKAEVSAEPPPRLSAFLAWAKEHLAKREARISAQAIEGRFLLPSICSVTMMIMPSRRPDGFRREDWRTEERRCVHRREILRFRSVRNMSTFS